MERYPHCNPDNGNKAAGFWLVLLIFGFIALCCLAALIFGGCASQKAGEGGAAQGVGFQSASGNKLETGDIGDKFEDIKGGVSKIDAKIDKLDQKLEVAQKGIANIQTQKTEINSGKYLFWAIVAFCAAVSIMAYAYFHYKEVKRKTYIPPTSGTTP